MCPLEPPLGISFIAPLIKDEQIQTAQITKKPFQSTVFTGFCQLQHQFRDCVKLCFISKIAGLYPGCDCHVCFAYSNGTIQHKILLSGDKLQCLQFFPAECRWELDILVAVPFECFVGREAGTFDQPFSSVFIPEGMRILPYTSNYEQNSLCFLERRSEYRL